MRKQFVFGSVLLFAAVTIGGTAATAKAPPNAAQHVQLAPGNLHWMAVPPVLQAGARIAVLRGNPFKEGTFTMRLWFPAHYAIPPHWHPTTESFTVLKGEMFLGMGDKLDKSKARAVPALGFASMPPLNHHYIFTKEETVIDLTAYGPFQIYYVNPAEAPSQRTAAKP